MTNPPHRRTERWRDLPAAIVMLAPSLILLSVFVLYPLVRAVWLGQQRCDAQGNNCTSSGWGQYIDVIRSNEFRDAVVVTSKFAVITVPIGLALGVGLAALADKYVRGVGAFRAIFSSTVATSVAVASLMWYFLLQPSLGVLSNVGWLSDLFPVIKQPGLLNDQGTALPSVAASSIWASLGFTFILVTAGLQAIPRDLHEAAAIDGASGMRRFWSITIPLLGPTLALRRHHPHHQGVPGLRRDRPAHQRRPQRLDHSVDVPHLWTPLADQQRRRVEGDRGRAAVRDAARALGDPAPRHRPAGALWLSEAKTCQLRER